MQYPTTQQYKIALMIGQASFRTLEDVEVIFNPGYKNEPLFFTGGLAIVFKIKVKSKFYALKCFYKPADERKERLMAISRYLNDNPSPYFVDFKYLDNELWVDASDGGRGYDVVLMEWVEGQTLDKYLLDACAQKNTLKLSDIYYSLSTALNFLSAQPIAHGDLKPDNIIITSDESVCFIDYDGMYVPALKGKKANELGSPHYQSPTRSTEDFDEKIDEYSIAVLQFSLRYLIKYPQYLVDHYDGESLVLTKEMLAGKLPDNIALIVNESKNHQVMNSYKIIFSEKSLDKKSQTSFFEKNIDKWDWEGLSINKGLPWSEELIEKYEDRWKWDFISVNNGLFWSEELIEKYEDKWLWGENKEELRFKWIKLTQGGLSCNIGLPWSEELIEKYEDRWSWRELSSNKSLPWSEELIEKYKDKWNWGWMEIGLSYRYDTITERGLSRNEGLPWSEKLIEKYEKKWYWKVFSSNTALPWSEELIEKYKDKWNWDYSLCRNVSLPWSESLLEKYKDRLSWNFLSLNEALPWSESLLEKYKDRLNWNFLSLNEALPWSEELIEKYEDIWNWGNLSSNIGLPWSEELIEKHEDCWEWDRLSGNECLPWSEELIDKYVDFWEWDSLSGNKCLPWSEELIEQYEDLWDWYKLSGNIGLPWSESLIEKYKDVWEWDKLSGNIGLPWKKLMLKK